MPATDAGHDAAVDASALDSGLMDAATVDASDTDAGVLDATVSDDADTDATVLADAATDAGPGSDGGVLACADAVAGLESLIDIGGRACSVTVRFDYTTWAPLGYQVFCHAYGGVTEESARAQGEADTTFGDGSTLLSNPDTDYTYVFYESPGDFGGASVVRRDAPMTLFGGSIVWDGMGDINYPSEWRSASELASDCGLPADRHTLVGWDLQNGSALSLEDADVGSTAIARTGAFDAMSAGGYVFSTIVLLYPRTVGVFDPDRAEWVVILNGGWLE